jgi:hypothetical protein
MIPSTYLVRHVMIHNEYPLRAFLLLGNQRSSWPTSLVKYDHFVGIIGLHLFPLLVGMQICSFREVMHLYEIFSMTEVSECPM